MATGDTTPKSADVIPIRPGIKPRRPRTPRNKQDREILVAIIEEHLASMEKAALVLAHNIERQRALLDQLKASEGWTWKTDAPSAFFGDAVLFQECELRVSDRVKKR